MNQYFVHTQENPIGDRKKLRFFLLFQEKARAHSRKHKSESHLSLLPLLSLLDLATSTGKTHRDEKRNPRFSNYSNCVDNEGLKQLENNQSLRLLNNSTTTLQLE